MAEFTGEIHPVADLFPMLADDELAELAEDIAARGLLQPIVLDPDGRLLDGRNRLAACEKASVEPKFAIFDGDDPDGYALTVNITRRHLTTGARAILAEQARRLNGNTKSGASKDLDGIHANRLIEAGLVLDWAPALGPAVVAGVTPLSKAIEEARDAKRDAEALDAKLSRLKADAPDLAALVAEEQLGVDDATAALTARETEAERVAAEVERKRIEERRDALALLDRILDLAAPVDMDDGWVEAWAARIGNAGSDRKTRTAQAGALLLALAERLQP